jgi:hypothetical protein
MKLSKIVIGAISASTIFECTYAYPGMGSTIREIEEKIQQRQYRPGFRRLPKRQPAKVADPNKVDNPNAADPVEAADPNAPADPNEVVDPNEAEDPNELDDPAAEVEVEAPLIGDIKDGGTTPIGQAIARIITAQESGQSSIGGYRIPGQLGSAKCKADTCCVWSFVSMQLTNLFRGQSGRCNKYARAAIRLGFHDAGTWEEGLDYGGADGSIILAKEEMARPDNRGLQDIVRVLGSLHRQTYKQYGVGMADLIQFAAKHAVVSTYLPPFPLSKPTNKLDTNKLHSLPPRPPHPHLRRPQRFHTG